MITTFPITRVTCYVASFEPSRLDFLRVLASHDSKMLFRSLLAFLLVTAVFAADTRRFLEEAASEGAMACPTPGSPTIVLTQLDSGGSIPLLPTAGPGRPSMR